MTEYFAGLPDESARVPALDRAIETTRDRETFAGRLARYEIYWAKYHPADPAGGPSSSPPEDGDPPPSGWRDRPPLL